MNAVDAVTLRHNLKPSHPRPSSPITNSILSCLDAFADAGRGRYANFASLGDPNLGNEEPIRKWWGDVAELILSEHYYGRPAQRRVEANANIVDAMMASMSTVLFTNESGDTMQDIKSASIRTGQTAIVQKFGRFYALTIVRWLALVFSDLCNWACYQRGIDAFFGVWEYFQTYTVDDDFLRSRKNWPLS